MDSQNANRLILRKKQRNASINRLAASKDEAALRACGAAVFALPDGVLCRLRALQLRRLCMSFHIVCSQAG
jgi:hypothetical protein